MPSLRLIRPSDELTDAIPFPRRGGEPPRWGRLVGVDPIEMAEGALRETERGFRELESLLRPFDFGEHNDGPRAA